MDRARFVIAGCMSRRAWFAFAAMSTIWGVPYMFIKIAVDDGVPPAFLAWVRVILAAALLLAISWRVGTLRTVRGRWRWLAVFALVPAAVAQDDPLPSCNDGPAKAATVRFVGDVTRRGGSGLVSPIRRSGLLSDPATFFCRTRRSAPRESRCARSSPGWSS